MTDRLLSLLHSRPPVWVVLFLAVVILFFAGSVSFWSAGEVQHRLVGCHWRFGVGGDRLAVRAEFLEPALRHAPWRSRVALGAGRLGPASGAARFC